MTAGTSSGRWQRANPAPPSTRYCAMLTVDIAAFGSRRDHDVQRHLREALYRIVQGACRAAGVPLNICHCEDRGDGVLLITPPCVSAETLLDQVVNHLRAGVRRHNKLAGNQTKIRLRTAVHAGHITLDPNGASGAALIHLFRLLEAPQFKDTFEEKGSEFAVVTSDRLYDDVVRHGPGLIDPSLYQPIMVALKETRARAWIWVSSPRPPAPKPSTSVSPPNLTVDDVDLARLIAAGRGREQIAEELGISVRDAETRICHLFAKLCLATPAADITAPFRTRPSESAQGKVPAGAETTPRNGATPQ